MTKNVVLTKRKKNYKPPYKYVEVVWEDATSNSESWVHINDIVAPERVVTRGWLVKETEKAVTLASSVSLEEDFEETVGNTMTVPVGMIVSRRELRVSVVNNDKPKPKHDNT